MTVDPYAAIATIDISGVRSGLEPPVCMKSSARDLPLERTGAESVVLPRAPK